MESNQNLALMRGLLDLRATGPIVFVMAGAISGLAAIGVLWATPRFTCLPAPDNHTHLSGYTRTVSLHRGGSRTSD